MGARSWSTAEINFPSMDWCSQKWIGLHSGCATGSFGKNQNVLPVQFGVARLLKNIVELVYMGILSLSFGAWSILCRAAVWPRFVAKLSERGFLFARIEWCMIRRISGRKIEMGAAVRSCWRSKIRSISSGKRRLRRRAVELQEQAEVLAKVMKEQFDQKMNALSPSLITPPPFPPSPPGVPSIPLAVEERRRQNDLLGAPQLRWIEAELLHKVSFVRNGVTEMSSSKLLGAAR